MLIKSGLQTNPSWQQPKVVPKPALLGWGDFLSWSIYLAGTVSFWTGLSVRIKREGCFPRSPARPGSTLLPSPNTLLSLSSFSYFLLYAGCLSLLPLLSLAIHLLCASVGSTLGSLRVEKLLRPDHVARSTSEPFRSYKKMAPGKEPHTVGLSSQFRLSFLFSSSRKSHFHPP